MQEAAGSGSFSITQLAQESGKLWNEMSDEQKRPFFELQEADRRRYNREMKEFEELGYFVNSQGVKSTDIALCKPKFKKDVVMPKKVCTPYSHYVKSQFRAMQQAHPSLSFVEISKQLSIRWNEQMTDFEKKPYHDLADIDRSRYDREYQDLLTKGYFMTVDGVKSTTLKKKVKRVNHQAIAESAALLIKSEVASQFGASQTSTTSASKKTTSGGAVKRAQPESPVAQSKSSSASKKLKKSTD